MQENADQNNSEYGHLYAVKNNNYAYKAYSVSGEAMVKYISNITINLNFHKDVKSIERLQLFLNLL